LVNGGDRNSDTVDVDVDAPIETFADALSIKIGLLVGDLRRMEENAVLNDAAHLVAGIRLLFVRHVVVVTVYRRDATDRTSAHGTRGLQTSVNLVIRQIDGE
jgi:hypothetical protein